MLGSVYLDENTSDRTIWTSEPLGVFSCKSFRRRLITAAPSNTTWKLIWAINMSFQIKTFMWILMRGRLLVRDKIFKLNLISTQLNICPFCSHFEEDIFIHCQKTSLIWHKMVSFWDVSLVCPRSIFEFFEYWYYTNLLSRSILAWCVVFYAMAWSIWNVKNCIVFHQKIFDEYASIELFRYHYTWWVRKVLEDAAPIFVDISRCPIVFRLLHNGSLPNIIFPGVPLLSTQSR